MTRNQIEYWALQETKRSNQAKEAETSRANLAKEREDRRSHMAQESQTALRDAETMRHNKSSEILSGLGISVDKQNAATREREAAAKEEANRIASDSNRIREGELSVKQQEADTRRLGVINDTGSVGKGYVLGQTLGSDLGTLFSGNDSSSKRETLKRVAKPFKRVSEMK